jgi:hypothetical protein
MGVFYHLVIFTWKQPGSKHTYKRVAAFGSATEMERWVEKNGEGIGLWVVPSREDNLPDNEEVGGYPHVGWNGRQWIWDYMHAAPIDGTHVIDNERAI